MQARNKTQPFVLQEIYQKIPLENFLLQNYNSTIWQNGNTDFLQKYKKNL
ncbi:hypothetical protein F480_02005 [Bibersteinia trehalosi Y31]|uniref:Uncharacterized protein n=1 Tax=Bibersteinia trehalosi Y31 TaxID=1261658 RepID=A0A179D0V7_BIBTR|nr:hypothetical protein F480_02005 [Bibersteinia trehalosi Y31]